MLGIFLGVFVFLMVAYVLIFFRDANPFSELPYAGESLRKGCLLMAVKAVMVAYALLDVQGLYEFESTLAFTVILLLLLIYMHYEVGKYKLYYRHVDLHFVYFCLTLGILHCVDFNGGETSTFLYLIPLSLLTFFTCKWVCAWKDRRIAATRFVLIEDPKTLEEHAIFLIQLIDSIHLRENKVTLEGYIQYHRRECRVGEKCPCRRMGCLKEETDETIKL
jgi:hypothetical protein